MFASTQLSPTLSCQVSAFSKAERKEEGVFLENLIGSRCEGDLQPKERAKQDRDRQSPSTLAI